MAQIESSTVPVSQKTPWAAFFLTLVFPGLGHFYLGRRYAALAYGAMGAGIYYSYLASQSFLARIAILGVIPFVLIPAARDAVAIARGKKKIVTGEESRVYVLWMVCCVGPFSLPLLWQNKNFPFLFKLLLTLSVISIVLFFLYAVKSMGQSYDQITQAISIANPS